MDPHKMFDYANLNGWGLVMGSNHQLVGILHFSYMIASSVNFQSKDFQNEYLKKIISFSEGIIGLYTENSPLMNILFFKSPFSSWNS